MKLIVICFLFLSSSCLHDKKYCGKIIDKGYDPPSSGYKTNRDATYFVILQVDSINLPIRIEVTVPTYYTTKLNNRYCFDLNEEDMYSYGNGTNHLIK